jgi:hypothetical protein
MGDVPAGEYIVRTRIDDRLYTHRVSVDPGEIVSISFVDRPIKDVLDVGEVRRKMAK